MVLNLLDSSVWVALYLDFDSNHDKAIGIYENIKGKIAITNLVMEEVVTVLTYKHSREQSDNFIKFIISNSDIDFINYDFNNVLSFHLNHSHKISLTDSSLIFLSKKNNTKIYSFDKKLVSLSV